MTTPSEMFHTRSTVTPTTVVEAVPPVRSNSDLSWLTASALTIVVIGASGDLAKKKTFPSLLNLYDDNLIPPHVRIYGYARSPLTDEELRNRLRPYLLENKDHSVEVVEQFLQICFYQSGTSYGDVSAYRQMMVGVQEFETSVRSSASVVSQEASSSTTTGTDQPPSPPPPIRHYNRLFYFAIPPSLLRKPRLRFDKRVCKIPRWVGHD
jgi:glucose-6-phosphate 1-dehydrogenase